MCYTACITTRGANFLTIMCAGQLTPNLVRPRALASRGSLCARTHLSVRTPGPYLSTHQISLSLHSFHWNAAALSNDTLTRVQTCQHQRVAMNHDVTLLFTPAPPQGMPPLVTAPSLQSTSSMDAPSGSSSTMLGPSSSAAGMPEPRVQDKPFM